MNNFAAKTLLPNHPEDSLWEALKDICFPSFCVECGKRIHGEENLYFCESCWGAVSLMEKPYCQRCGKPAGPWVGFELPHEYVCAECRSREHKCSTIRSVGIYSGVLEQAIGLLKFRGKRLMAGPLADLLAKRFDEEMAEVEFDVAMSVPLHKVRERERGFNQSRLLLEELRARRPGLAISEQIVRHRPTRSQVGLKAEERRKNLRGAFSLRHGSDLKGKSVLLVDDVVTTGSTLEECARVLVAAGTREVRAITVATVVSNL